MKKYCPCCEKSRETVRDTRPQKYRVKGQWVSVDVTADFCAVCDEAIMTDEEDQAVLDEIHRKGGEDG